MLLPKQNKHVSYFVGNLERFKENAAGSNLSEVQSWLKDNSVLERAHKNLKKEQEVYTLLSPEKSKKISSFFYLPVIFNADNIEVDAAGILKADDREGVLICGRLGQGKSILLRYLQFLELNTGDTLPIFLELRKIKQASQIVESSCDNLNKIGLPCSHKLFSFLLMNGYVSLFLDGYDEISLEHREEFNNAISDIFKKYPKAKIIVTSRFDTEIYKNKYFNKYKIAPLKEVDVAPFVKTILSNPDHYGPILSKVSESKDFDYEILDTPLMITWFIVVYNKRLKIPKARLGFYEDLFSAILSRHDGLKDSYNRASKSKLSDDDVKAVFCALCYITRKEEERVFSSAEILDFIRRALNISGFKSVKSQDYLYDLTHVTCLLKKDGIDYEFIHESVVHYFSALFLKSQTETNSKRFYTNRVADWNKYDEELHFLSIIDRVRFVQYFFIPEISNLFESEARIKNEVLTDLFKNALIATRKQGDEADFVKNTNVHIFSSKSYSIRELVEHKSNLLFKAELPERISHAVRSELTSNKLAKEILVDCYVNANKDLEYLWIVNFNQFLIESKIKNKISLVANKFLVEKMNMKLASAHKIIEREEDKEDLFS